MTTMRVVEAFDEVEDHIARVVVIAKTRRVDQLALENRVFGLSATTLRPTRSGAGRPDRSRRVVTVDFRRLTPARADAFIKRAIRLRPTFVPSSCSSE